VSFDARIYKVLIASPSDTGESRQAILQAIVEWNDLNSEGYGVVLLPVMWEMSSTPSVGASPQAIINDQIVDGSDIVVAVFWTRLGTPTETEASGSVEEIRRKGSQGAPVLLYFSDQPAEPHTVDPAQLQAVQDFRTSMQDVALLGQYETIEGLSHTVQRDLTRTVQRLHGQVTAEEAPTAAALSGPTGPTGPPGPPGPPAPTNERVLDAYKGDLRGLLARQRVQFDGAAEQQDSDGVRRIITELSRGLSTLVGAVAELSPEAANSTLSIRLIELTRTSASLGQLRMYLDGGHSWNQLIEGSFRVFESGAALLDLDWNELVQSTNS